MGATMMNESETMLCWTYGAGVIISLFTSPIVFIKQFRYARDEGEIAFHAVICMGVSFTWPAFYFIWGYMALCQKVFGKKNEFR